jgi:hypothetical protein
VVVQDLLGLLAAFGSAGGGNPSTDMNGDGVVNVVDLLDLLSAYSQQTDCGAPPPPPSGMSTTYPAAPARTADALRGCACGLPATSDPATSDFATINVDSHVGDFVAGEPVNICFTDAANCVAGADGCLWDDWVGIYPVVENPDWTDYAEGHWSYHGSGDAGSGCVTITPAEFGDYYVVLLGGADGYTELTDPDNRLVITVANWVPLAEPEITVGDCRTAAGSHGCGSPVALPSRKWPFSRSP